MANIKKAFQPVMSLLAANMDASVSEIYDQAVELTSAKTGGGGSKELLIIVTKTVTL